MPSIQQNIQHITQQIQDCEKKYARPAHSVSLLAVSKTKPNEAILEAAKGGQQAFGENYVQEGVDKVQYFSEKHPELPLTWHFIGPIQSNKTRPIAEHFDWIHTIERTKIAQRLSDQRPDHLSPLQVLIQVNTSNEASKSGIILNKDNQEELFELAEFIHQQPNLILRGLMSIPASQSDYDSQLNAFNQLSKYQSALIKKYPEVDTLSIGMSGDMEAAIEAGSTCVRIGTAIFGSR